MTHEHMLGKEAHIFKVTVMKHILDLNFLGSNTLQLVH